MILTQIQLQIVKKIQESSVYHICFPKIVQLQYYYISSECNWLMFDKMLAQLG